MATPLEIEMAIWYVTRGASAGDFGTPEGRKDAPAVQEALARFVQDELLIPHPGETRDYSATDGLKLYLEQLCAVSFPVRVWSMPPSLDDVKDMKTWPDAIRRQHGIDTSRCT